MISINPFLSSPRERRAGTRTRTISTLLEGIARHSFAHDPNEAESFRRSLEDIGEEIAAADDDESASLLAAAAIRRLSERTEAAERDVASRRHELETVLALVSDCLISIGQVDGKLSVELREIERDIPASRDAAEAAAVRARLTRCLDGIRALVLRRNQEAMLSSQVHSKDEIDVLTGLPDSRKAAEAITAAWDRREDYSAAVFGVRRLDNINARYGFQAGDEMLQVMSTHVTEVFGAMCLLFRWRGPYLFALLDKHSTDFGIVPQLKRLDYTNLQRTLSVRDREVMLSISIASKLVPLEASSVEDMIRVLDEVTTTRLR